MNKDPRDIAMQLWQNVIVACHSRTEKKTNRKLPKPCDLASRQCHFGNVTWQCRRRPVWTHKTLFLAFQPHSLSLSKRHPIPAPSSEKNPTNWLKKQLILGVNVLLLIKNCKWEDSWRWLSDFGGDVVSWSCYKLRALQASKTIPDTTITSYFSSTSNFQKKFSSSNFQATFRRLSGEVPARFFGEQKVSKCPKFSIYISGEYL